MHESPTRTLQKSRTRRVGIRLLQLLITAIFFWSLTSFLAVRQLTRRIDSMKAEITPSIDWGKITSFRLPTSDGQELGAWFIDGATDRPIVLLLHGNGANRSMCLSEAEMLSKRGNAVLLITFRTHGDSTGEVNDFGFSNRFDVLSAVSWIHKNHPNQKIVLWGRSLGSAACLFAAKDLGDQVHGYILECPYQDLRTATRNRTRNVLPWGLEYLAYTGLSLMAPVFLPDPDEISPINAAKSVPSTIPVLVLAGGIDRRATTSEAQAITDTIGNQAEFNVFENADHLGLQVSDPVRFKKMLDQFLDRCSRSRS